MPLQEVSLALDKGRKRGNAVSYKVLCLGHDGKIQLWEVRRQVIRLYLHKENKNSQKQVEPDHMISHFIVGDGGGVCDYYELCKWIRFI